MKKIITLIALVASVSVVMSERCMAQAVNINFDKKVIYTDSLNMPENCLAKYILNLLPDLLQRPGKSLINNYDIKIEDLSVGNIMDGVLTQLRLADIERFEVSESPLSTYMNNGQSGTINIILRQRPNKDNGMWGSVSLDAESPLDIYPKLTLGYKREKFTIRGLAFGDIYNSYRDNDITHYANGLSHQDNTEREKKKFWSSLMRVYMKYTPNDANTFQLNVSVGLSKTDITTSHLGTDEAGNSKKDKTTTLRVMSQYVHQFSKKSNLKAEIQYIYEPADDEVMSAGRLTESDKDKHTLAGKVEYKHLLTSVNSKNKSLLTLGLKENYTYTNDAFEEKAPLWTPNQYASNYHDGSYAPYLESENQFGKFRLKAELQLQVSEYDIHMYTGDIHKQTRRNVLGKIMSEWHFNRTDFMRVILDRKLMLPSNAQIFPHLYLAPSSMNVYLGNEDLKNTITHQASAEYFNFRRWGRHSLQLNTGLSYYNIRRVITSNNKIKQTDNGESFDYMTYDNNGSSNLYNLNIMALYTYKAMSLSLTGNFFHNNKEVSGVSNHHRYFNLMLMPSFHTKAGWEGALRLTYNSQVEEEHVTLGSCTQASFNFGKDWGNWNAHIYGRLALSGRTTNTTYDSSDPQIYTTETNYLGRNTIGAGFLYRF